MASKPWANFFAVGYTRHRTWMTPTYLTHAVRERSQSAGCTPHALSGRQTPPRPQNEKAFPLRLVLAFIAALYAAPRQDRSRSGRPPPSGSDLNAARTNVLRASPSPLPLCSKGPWIEKILKAALLTFATLRQ